MKNFVGIFLLIIQVAHSKISLQIIQRVNSTLFINGNQKLLYSVINPIFGEYLSTNNYLKTIRYYGSYSRPRFYKCQGIIEQENYTEDLLNNSTMNLLLYLFSSQKGKLVAMESDRSFLGSDLLSIKNDLKNNIGKLSETFIKILKKNSKSKIVNKIKCLIFSKLIDVVFLSDIETNQDIQKKLCTMHSYALNILDTEYEYKRYLKGILKRLNKEEKDKMNILELSDEQKEEFNKLANDLTEFPYSKINQPSVGSFIPIFIRFRNSYVYDAIETFYDNTEMCILHILHFLLYDEELKQYSLTHLNLDKNSQLLEFFNKYPKGVFNITNKIRNDWSKVVQCLEDHPCDDNNEYRPNIIQYSRSSFRNEISPGIINILSVLTTICNSKQNCIYINYYNTFKSSFDLEKCIIKKLEDILKLIASPKLVIKCRSINSPIKLSTNSRCDIFCDVNIILRSKIHEVEIKTEFILNVLPSQANIIFVSRKNSLEITPSFENLMKIEESEDLMASLLKQYIFIVKNDNLILEISKNLLNIPYNQSQSIKNEKIRNYLLILLQYKESLDKNSEYLQIIEKIYNNILKSISLTDKTTKDIILPYYYDIKDKNEVETQNNFNINYKN